MKMFSFSLKQTRHNLNDGFTLIELLVVVAIIGILAAIVVVRFNVAITKAREGRTFANLSTLRTAVNMSKIINDTWPNQITDGSVPGWGDQSVVPPMDQYLNSVPLAEVCTLPDDFSVNSYVQGVWNDNDLPGWILGNTQGFFYARNTGDVIINNGNFSTTGIRYQEY